MPAINTINTLPYDYCDLNLYYVISKNKELVLTSNMMIMGFLFILYCLYSNYSSRINRLMSMLNKYVELIENINDNHNMFDFVNGTHNLYDPSGMLEFYTESDSESKSDCESCEDSESESDQDSHENEEPVESNNRRILRSETRKRETEYQFDRDYSVPLVRNRKSKSASTLGIRGKTWHLD